MRYEDASHTGAFQGQGPIANDDTDQLAAGAKSTATGNLISGEGTQSGSVGADVATGGHITAIAGKGGEDSSFAGGKLSALGEYGKLSVDAEGNYVYQANQGVENVRDRFTYTLADNQGASDTASLIVEIGKTPLVIKADAQQIVVGPDGVVTLPAGVELSDIHIVGRNLVVDMPDGSQMIIIDGAIFVPQLVLGGVEVPATNVAALLVGQEIQPAAGETPPSGGGNFAVPPPPLDPGVPLGDLIPPTEYVYIPPEPQDVFDILDQEPEIFIQPDGQPAAVNAVDSVDEKGLPTRNGGEPEGSGEQAAAGADGDPSEATAGTIIINSPDGVDSVTIAGANGIPVEITVGLVVQGAYGTLTITGIVGSNFTYSYVLNDNISHNDANPDHDDFSVTLTDNDGDQASATLAINIIDDVPTARNDTDASVNGVATGNVMTDAAPGDVGDSDTNAADTVGADNATLTAVSGTGGSDSTFSGGFLNVNGSFGSLAIDAQGNYTYTVNPDVGGGGVDVFTYTLTDSDGDTTTATLTITNPDLTPTLPDPALIRLDDDVIPGAGGNVDGPGDDDPDAVPGNVVNGNLVGSGGDGDLDYAFTGVNTLPAGFTANALDADTVQIIQNGTVVLTIDLNVETGAFTVTQNAPIVHPTLNGVAGDDTENNLDFSIGVQVRDVDGDVEPASITINVDDDTPTVTLADRGEPQLVVDETNLAANDSESFALNFSVSFGADGPGAGGGLSYLLGINAGATGLVDTLSGEEVVLSLVGGQVVGTAGAGGPTVFVVSVDANGVVTLDQQRAVIHTPDSGPNQTTSLAADNLVTLTATATDSDGDSASETLNIGLNLTFHDDAPSAAAGQVTGTVDEDGVPGGIADGPADVAGEVTVATGSVSSLFNSGADQPLSYGFAANAVTVLEALGLTSGGDALDYNIVGDTVTASTAAGDVFSFTLNANGNWEFELLGQLDHPTLNGQPGDDTENDLSFNLGAIILATDADGDSVAGNANGLVITVDDDTPVARNDEDTVPAGGDIITGNVITGANTDTGAAGADSPGADAPASIIGLASINVPANVDNNSAGGFVVAGAYGTLTLQANGSYSYDRNPGSPGNVEDAFTYTYQDADGDKVTATLTININDSAPTLPDPALIRLDDDVIPGAGGNVDGPGDDDPDAVPGNVVNGNLVGSGGDGTLTYSFTGTNTLPTGFSVGAGSDADTLLINQGGTLVMTIQLNLATGAFTVTQNAPMLHPADNGGPEDNIENNFSFSIGVQVQDADSDADPATITINVDDDTPTINVTQTGENGVVLTTQDAETDGNPTAQDTDVSAINFGGVFGLTQSAGADGTAAAAVLSYDLNVAAQNSGLASHGLVINLFEVGGVIYGTTAGVAPVDATTPGVVFSLAVSNTGVVTLTQFQQVDHAVEGVTTSPFDDQFATLVNGKITLTASSSLTDRDGDTVTDQEVIDLGGNIRFADDGPSATIAETGQSVSVDESVGIQADSNDTTNAGVIALFAGVANVGTDTHLPQYAQNASAVVNSTGSAYGADGAGSTVFSLNVSAAGVDSGLDTTSGQSILLFKEGSLIVGRVSGGADDGKAAFAIAIDPVTGVISTVEYLSIYHPNAANPDDSVSIADGAVLAVVTVTDFDGDTATQQVGIGSAIQFQDSAPVMTSASNINIQNSGDVAHTGAFAFNLGADGANASNDVITNLTGSATVGGVAVTNWVLTPGVENATTATYSFSFDYPVGGGSTAHETGTLVFDKVAGTYTIDLANPIQGVTTILQTAEGTLFQGYEFGSSTVDGSQPEISVTQIQDLAGTANDIYVQFTSVAEPSSGTGDNALEVSNWVPGADNPAPIASGGDTSWSAGQLFNQEDSWVSTSNSANGVAGDTIQGGEVLDFSLVQGANPTGNLAQPATFAQASAMFLKFDGIGEGEDMIVVLKLYDPNTNTYTTRAIMVENADIQKGPGAGPGQYSGITLDNNDGLVIIESNDYNLPGENWVIVGAQIAGSDEGVTGTAINLNSAIGAAGDSITAGAFDLDADGFQSDTNDGPFKISSIGFLTTSTTPQNAQLDFNVTVTDGDGDSITQAITATVTPAVDSSTPIALAPAVVTIQSAPSDSSFSLLAADSGEGGQTQKQAANSNTLTMASAVAAAGMADSAAASPPADVQSADISDPQVFTTQVVEKSYAEDGGDGSAVAGVPEVQEADGAPGNSGGHGNGNSNGHDNQLDAGSDNQSADDASSKQAANDDQGPVTAEPQVATTASVTMASAEELQAADFEGGAKHNGAVEKIVAEALGQGNGQGTVDALLNAIHGGNGDGPALASLASPSGAAVSAWDMASNGGSAGNAEMLMKVGAEMLHHDMVQPTHNG